MDLSQAPATEIADIIDRCPSKALQYELLNPISIVFEEALDRSAAYDRGKQIGECEYSPYAKKMMAGKEEFKDVM